MMSDTGAPTPALEGEEPDEGRDYLLGYSMSDADGWVVLGGTLLLVGASCLAYAAMQRRGQMSGVTRRSSLPSQARQRPHQGMMGDGTQGQTLGQQGASGARINREEVEAAFGDQGHSSDK